ncbi:hypothetical protein MGG_16078 [Pyricularia oryzae 70-15]|uniref:Uncharacterized protein n=1 Tax=Pyricularia oryzae (strain 70-15 / ATCC MYA-4617 / FGSC 8958) TaxID=242507 RepID=G4MQ25_PYRO7|nr:uncharacterized protein MGG_16078 [Pyricularia oryzae 70-15]EHA56418.1 hypothetical protein MGG_16078 [Pyricularia oryzae 70-15]
MDGLVRVRCTHHADEMSHPHSYRKVLRKDRTITARAASTGDALNRATCMQRQEQRIAPPPASVQNCGTAVLVGSAQN